MFEVQTIAGISEVGKTNEQPPGKGVYDLDGRSRINHTGWRGTSDMGEALADGPRRGEPKTPSIPRARGSP